MKVCKRGLRDIWINEYDGKVRMCGWTNYFIGNLVDNSIEELWNGEKAEIFRTSMLDGSYRFCNHTKCPYCANDKFEEMLVDYEVPKLPTFCSVGYQRQCNYVCKFCRTEHYKLKENEKENYPKIENEIRKMLPTLEMFAANGAGEFFCSDSIIRLIKNYDFNSKMNIGIETNGSLFTEENWKKISKLGNHKLSVGITIHSFQEDTYQYLSGTILPITQIIDNLKFVSNLRKQGVINKLEIATVVCERNFREMPEFVQKCLNEFEVDSIRLRFFEPYGVMDPLTEWFYDVRNNFHPYHEEFVRVMNNPIFDNPKVWKWQGETESFLKESPYYLEKRRGDTLASFLCMKDLEEKMSIYCSINHIRSIALFGAAKVGVAYQKIFFENGIKIDTIFDSYACEQKLEGFEIRRPNSENINQYDLILITTDTFEKQILETLNRLNFKGSMISMFDLLNSIIKLQI